jgi:hypothetical protein
MKLSTREDIEAPVSFVYAALSDFETWERAALRRGADVSRIDSTPKPAPGMGWKVTFPYRGKQRKVEIKLAKLLEPQELGFEATSAPLNGALVIELVEMSAKRTRVSVASTFKPNTLAARLFIQSLRLAKAKLSRRFELRVAQLAADIEDRYRAEIKR